ncbi:Protein SPA, chloroplastic [Galdieria sulphuraria]|nr:Protein SPA, chloroplastic [Galdieria sulphuraria]
MIAFVSPTTILSFRRDMISKKATFCFHLQGKQAAWSRQVCRRGSVYMSLDAGYFQGFLTAALGLTAGIAFLVWTEKQGVRGSQRENLQPCVVCNGQKRLECIRCKGSGKNPTEESELCSFCDGVGTVVCSNCAGGGIQPRNDIRIPYH